MVFGARASEGIEDLNPQSATSSTRSPSVAGISHFYITKAIRSTQDDLQQGIDLPKKDPKAPASGTAHSQPWINYPVLYCANPRLGRLLPSSSDLKGVSGRDQHSHGIPQKACMAHGTNGQIAWLTVWMCRARSRTRSICLTEEISTTYQKKSGKHLFVTNIERSEREEPPVPTEIGHRSVGYVVRSVLGDTGKGTGIKFPY